MPDHDDITTGDFEEDMVLLLHELLDLAHSVHATAEDYATVAAPFIATYLPEGWVTW